MFVFVYFYFTLFDGGNWSGGHIILHEQSIVKKLIEYKGHSMTVWPQNYHALKGNISFFSKFEKKLDYIVACLKV